jgi:uncharacterized protein YceK
MNNHNKHIIISFIILVLTLSGCAKVIKRENWFRGINNPTKEAQTVVFTPIKDNINIKITTIHYSYESEEKELYPEELESYGQKCKGPWFDVYTNGETITVILQRNAKPNERKFHITFKYLNPHYSLINAQIGVTVTQAAGDSK